jgi:uncharacterized integral membrane protein
MFDNWRRQRAARRVTPGDGRELRRFRWWQPLSRALLYLPLSHEDGERTLYAVDVRHWQSEPTAHLYLNGRHHAKSVLPAVLPVHGGTIEVRASAFGLKRCHYVTTAGAERQLVPDRRSAEGRRAHLDRAHPVLSRWLGTVSTVVLALSLLLLLAKLAEQLTRAEGISRLVGTFTSPVHLPGWLAIVAGVLAAAASTERALRLRYHWLLDGGAG